MSITSCSNPPYKFLLAYGETMRANDIIGWYRAKGHNNSDSIETVAHMCKKSMGQKRGLSQCSSTQTFTLPAENTLSITLTTNC